MELAGDGETAQFNDLDINGGMLTISGDNLSQVNISGKFKVGSGINMMGNNVIDTIDATKTDGIEIYEGRNFDLWIDIDPKTNTADNIIAPNCKFTEGSSIIINDFKTLSDPTEDRHVFKVLKLTDSNAKYVPILIGSDAASKQITGKLGIYKLYAGGGLGCISLLKDGLVVEDWENKISYEDAQAVRKSFLPLKNMHSASFNSISGIYSDVINELNYYKFDNNGIKSFGKYRFWNKTMGTTEKVKTSEDTIKNSGYGDILGIDIEPKLLQNKMNLMPTIFINYDNRNLKLTKNKSHQNNYLIGGKLALFNEKFSVEALGSYKFVKTNFENNSLRSHIFSCGIASGFNIKCNKLFTIKPDILNDFSYITTSGYKLSDKKIKNKGRSIFNVAPGLNLIYENKMFDVIATSRFHQKIGGAQKSYLDDDRITTISERKKYMEYGLNLKNKTLKNFDIGLTGTIYSHGRKGAKISLNMSTKY